VFTLTPRTQVIVTRIRS